MEQEMMNEKRMQVKCNYDEGMMHIQVVCDQESSLSNRPYGYTVRMPCENKVSQYLRLQDPVLNSAAGTGVNYTAMTALSYPEHTIAGRPAVQFLIHGTEFNHPQGLVCSVAMSKSDIISLVKYLMSVDMLVEQQGIPFIGESQEEE
jgi:hypothetical protein|tara:strand:+ start:11368 stop:11808 length:441 start_codon:yes stop_codon:yes gene_type:complete